MIKTVIQVNCNWIHILRFSLARRCWFIARRFRHRKNKIEKKMCNSFLCHFSFFSELPLGFDFLLQPGPSFAPNSTSLIYSMDVAIAGRVYNPCYDREIIGATQLLMTLRSCFFVCVDSPICLLQFYLIRFIRIFQVSVVFIKHKDDKILL
jgi:hypothetical protein